LIKKKTKKVSIKKKINWKMELKKKKKKKLLDIVIKPEPMDQP
jgi:hypothetical protein